MYNSGKNLCFTCGNLLETCWLSWATIVDHSMDKEEVGVAHKVNSTKNQPQMKMGVRQNKLSDQPEMLLKSCHGIFWKTLVYGIFYWLTNNYLMPSDQHNSIMAKATGLICYCSMSIQPERCLLAYCTAVHAMHSSGTYQCPPLRSIHLCW